MKYLSDVDLMNMQTHEIAFAAGAMFYLDGELYVMYKDEYFRRLKEREQTSKQINHRCESEW